MLGSELLISLVVKVKLTFASVLWIANLSLTKSKGCAGELSSARFRSADVVLDEQHVVLVRIQSFHF